MKDQPFKRGGFPTDKTKLESYKYPTYQHYYQSKRSQGKVVQSPSKKDLSSDKSITDTDSDHQTAPPLFHKKSTKSNLKNELQTLKLEVQKIMERKQGILKTPIEKKLKLFPSLSESQLRITPAKSKSKEETDDNQSITSEKILEEPIKKLQLKAATENYDHAKYMELENELLKTELKNLKNKYVSKKQELNQKCDALQKKVAFLESSLYNSEETLCAQISSLKANIKQMEKEREAILTPTKSKEQQQKSPIRNIERDKQIQSLQQALQKLNKQILLKDKVLETKDTQIQNLNLTVSELKVELEQFKIENIQKEVTSVEEVQKNLDSTDQNKVKELEVQLEELRKINRVNNQLLEEKEQQIVELEASIFKLKEQRFSDSNKKVGVWEQKLQQIRQQFNKKLQQNQEQYDKINELNSQLTEENNSLKQKLSSGDMPQGSSEIIEELQGRLKEEQLNTQNIEEKYVKILEATEKKYEQKINSINLQFESKILARKDSKPIRDQSSNQGQNVPNREIKKWKLQYKHLKQKLQNHLKEESHKNKEFKIYYKNYREYKEKVETLTKQYETVDSKSQKYLYSLANKEKELLKKEAQIRRLTTEDKEAISKNNEQLNQLRAKCQGLEDKLKEEQSKYEKQVSYRKQIEEKIFAEKATEESLRETMERMKKRLVEQDEKHSKNVKELKNKDALNKQLKQELREVMENMEKQINQQKRKEIQQIIDNYIKKEFESFSQWRSKISSEKNILKESNDNFICEIDELKNLLDRKEETINSMRNQLNSFTHSYNLKNIEVNEILDQKQGLLNHYINQLQQLKIIKDSAEGILRDQIMEKNQQITSLRMELATQSMKGFQFRTFNSTFDNILKSHIEQNKKLREQITKKTEQIFKLRDNYGALRSQFENTKAQIEINKLKYMSEMKNMEVNFQVDLQKMKNQIDMAERKANLLEQKLKLVIEESHKKDSFIQNYIVSKKLVQGDKDIVVKFIKQYQITVGSSDIVQRLGVETKEIEQLNNYNRILLKQISLLKEKLIEYEAIDEGEVSIYDSKYSKRSHQSSEFAEEKHDQVEPDFEHAVKKTKKVSESKLKKADSVQVYKQYYQEE